ncbi:EVE domain-containing protein [Sinorhizobium meliloti]|nr:EVE domain-containing protein [Sinorhizobium meliloti]
MRRRVSSPMSRSRPTTGSSTIRRLEGRWAFWLYKSEPAKWSWQMQKDAGEKGTEWTGVRNYLARQQHAGDDDRRQGFFYHSNEGLEIVGITEVCALSHPDSTARATPAGTASTSAPSWTCHGRFPLKEIKENPKLAKMSLVTSMRLSVQPVTDDEWIEVCRMAGWTNPPR